MAAYDDILGTRQRPVLRQSPIPPVSPDIPGAYPSTTLSTVNTQPSTQSRQPETQPKSPPANLDRGGSEATASPSGLERGANKVSTPTTQNSQHTTQNSSSSAIETIIRENPRHLNYAQLYELLNAANRPETPEQQAAREKKEKRQALFSAIGDGISALSNLFFTSRYAPDSFNPSRAMSPTTRARWDRLRAEREANRRQYVDGYLRALQLDDADYRYERSWQHQLQREKLADDRAAAAEKRAAALAELNRKLKNHEIDAAAADAAKKEIEAAFAPEYQKSRIERNRAAAGASKAAGAASYARAKAEGRKDVKEFRAWDKDGKQHWFHTKEAAEEFARQEDTFRVERATVNESLTKTEKDPFGNPKTTTTDKTTEKDGAGYPVPYRPPYRDPNNSADDEFSQYEVKGEDQDDDFSQYER